MSATTKNSPDLRVPRWDLSAVYHSPQSSDYTDAFEAFTDGMFRFDALLAEAPKISGNTNFCAWLDAWLKNANKTGATAASLGAYIHALYTTDTTNAEYLNNLSRFEQLQVRSYAQDTAFLAILKKHSEYLDAFFADYPAYAPYRYVLSVSLESAAHMMSENEEKLAKELELTGGAAWERLHEQIISNTLDGEGRTFNEIRNLAYDADRTVRKNAWQTEIALLQANEIPLAASLNNLKGATVMLNKRRSWENAIDRSLHASRMTHKTLAALIGAIEDSLPVWRKYLQAKGALFGTKSGCAFYDLFAPLPVPSSQSSGSSKSPQSSGASEEKIWTFDDAKAYITERFSLFSADMGNFAKKAFDLHWIDAEVRRGKVGGAYCTDFPAHGQSRVLSNYTGVFGDVITLAHELGHAYHHSCITKKDFLLQQYPMTLAETASIFAENIVMRDAIAKSDGAEKMRLIESHLQDSCQVLVDILCRYYFEQSVFELRKTTELTAADFCALMRDAQEKSYGAGLCATERHEYMWAVKSHYYSPNLDFYNFPYAFGLLFGTGLLSIYERDGASFGACYMELLSKTGSFSCEDVCREAGFDITTKDFWALGISHFAKEIAEFCAFAEHTSQR
ncbi:MAG: M3 family oligoendopeptidase [Treponemataceae bacterium]|nr:MAG: M3 family oligoendopeptidase [Treponemataceae bacterium]